MENEKSVGLTRESNPDHMIRIRYSVCVIILIFKICWNLNGTRIVHFLYILILSVTVTEGGRWALVRAQDPGSRGRGFESSRGRNSVTIFAFLNAAGIPVWHLVSSHRAWWIFKKIAVTITSWVYTIVA